MNYNFIEIGSCDFDTLLQSCTDNEIGLTIEPIKKYLDNLPNRENVTKICAAVVQEDVESLDIFYVDVHEYDHDFDYWPGKRLPAYLKGCNSVSKPHDFHIACPENLSLAYSFGKNYVDLIKTYNLIESGYVKVERCRCITFEKLVKQFNIDYIEKIKINTEGQDPILLSSILDFYEQSNIEYPAILQFQTNFHNNTLDVDKVCNRLTKLGYDIDGWNGISFDRKLNECHAIFKSGSKISELVLSSKKIKRLEELRQLRRMHDGNTRENNYVSELIELIKKHLSSNFTICEIGSYRGVSSEVFAIFLEKVFCVDCWEGWRNYGDEHPLEPEEEFDVMSENYENIVKLKMRSVEASKLFENESIDAIYIDGDHQCSGFSEDMNNWIPKVKKEGYIIGHDWDQIYDCNRIHGWMDPSKVEIFNDDSWIIKKQDAS